MRAVVCSAGARPCSPLGAIAAAGRILIAKLGGRDFFKALSNPSLDNHNE